MLNHRMVSSATSDAVNICQCCLGPGVQTTTSMHLPVMRRCTRQVTTSAKLQTGLQLNCLLRLLHLLFSPAAKTSEMGSEHSKTNMYIYIYIYIHVHTTYMYIHVLDLRTTWFQIIPLPTNYHLLTYLFPMNFRSICTCVASMSACAQGGLEMSRSWRLPIDGHGSKPMVPYLGGYSHP